MSDQNKRIEDAAAWAQTPEGQAAFEAARKKAKATTDYLSSAREVTPEQLHSPLGLRECKNCDQLLARIKELEEREKEHSKMQEQGWAMLRAFQEIDRIVGRIKDMTMPGQSNPPDEDHLPEATKKVEPPADSWLGVWRAKKKSLGGIPFDIGFAEDIEVLEIRPNGIAFVKEGKHKGCLSVEFIQENFEKVTEEG